MMPRWVVYFLLLPAALVGLLLCAGIVLVVLALAPPVVSAVSMGVFALVGLWLVFRRRSAPGVAGSETALMGRQSSKEGLL